MYTAFYGLREKPFALSPNPRFLYLSAAHREALAHLLYGIDQGEGFIVDQRRGRDRQDHDLPQRCWSVWGLGDRDRLPVQSQARNAG